MDIQVTPLGIIIVVDNGKQYFLKVTDPSAVKTTVEIMKYGEQNFVRLDINTNDFKKDEPKYIEQLVKNFEEVMGKYLKENPPKPKETQNGKTNLKLVKGLDPSSGV